MKILQIVPSLTTGGAESICENLTCALSQMGHEVIVVSLFTMDTPISQRLHKAGIPVVFLDKKMGLDLSVVPKLHKLIVKEQPDAIHSHLYILKYVAAALPSKKIKLVHTIHSLAQEDAERDGFLYRRLFASGRVIPVSLSPEVQQSVMDYYKLPKDMSPVIYNGVDLSRCQPKESYVISGIPQLLHVGRFHEVKNHPAMLRAVRLLKDRSIPVHITFLGDGDTLPAAKALAKELMIEDSVTFGGLCQWVYPQLQKADIFLLPSLFEGMPVSIIEAMGTGLPIIATNVGGVNDMLEHDISGLLVEPKPEKIAGAIASLILSDEKREQIGRCAKEASVRFSAHSMAAQYERIYSQTHQ